MVVVFAADLRKLNCGFHHAPGRITPEGHHTRRKGAMVCTNTHSSVFLLALLDEWDEEFLDLTHNLIVLLLCT